MKDVEYTLYNDGGDEYYLHLKSDSQQFLSAEMFSLVSENDFELWGIYLERLGNAQKVTPMKLLNKISQLIATFLFSHPKAILYYQCDDISDVPMSFNKEKSGILVQEYRNRLFTTLFKKYAKKMDVAVVDTPIYIDACGNDIYIHLMSREIHVDMAQKISRDIHEGFDK